MVQADFDRVFRHPRFSFQTDELSVANDISFNVNDGVDVILTPTTIDFAPRVQENNEFNIKSHNNSRLNEYLNDVMTVPASLAGLPAISIPYFESKKNIEKQIKEGILLDMDSPSLPLGVQVIGQAHHDCLVLRVAEAMQNLSN